MEGMFFGGMTAIARTLIVGTLVYVALVFLLRISGKRTLSKMNAFDFVVTVAIGSTLATALLSQTVSMAQGIVALALLVALQWVITLLSVRSGWVRRLVKSEPQLLMRRGRFLEASLRSARVTREEILQAARSRGVGRLEDIEAIVLETDGTFSVIQSGTANDSAMSNVREEE